MEVRFYLQFRFSTFTFKEINSYRVLLKPYFTYANTQKDKYLHVAETSVGLFNWSSGKENFSRALRNFRKIEMDKSESV